MQEIHIWTGFRVFGQETCKVIVDAKLFAELPGLMTGRKPDKLVFHSLDRSEDLEKPVDIQDKIDPVREWGWGHNEVLRVPHKTPDVNVPGEAGFFERSCHFTYSYVEWNWSKILIRLEWSCFRHHQPLVVPWVLSKKSKDQRYMIIVNRSHFKDTEEPDEDTLFIREHKVQRGQTLLNNLGSTS